MADQHPANPVSQVSCAHLSILSLTLCNLSFRARDPIGSALHIGDALVRKESKSKQSEAAWMASKWEKMSANPEQTWSVFKKWR